MSGEMDNMSVSESNEALPSDKPCPVILEIDAIKAGGYYHDDDSTSNVFVVGGASDASLHVCDDVDFYINMKRIEVARLEAQLRENPALVNKVAYKYNELFKWMEGATADTIIKHIMDRSQLKKYLLDEIIKIIDMIYKLEETINFNVLRIARTGKKINVSLPNIDLPEIDINVIYDPNVLYKVLISIVTYINGVNIKSLIGQSPNKIIPVLPPNIEDDSPAPHGYNYSATISSMKELLKIEIGFADYVKRVEAYQCHAMTIISKIRENLNMLCGGLTR